MALFDLVLVTRALVALFSLMFRITIQEFGLNDFLLVSWRNWLNTIYIMNNNTYAYAPEGSRPN